MIKKHLPAECYSSRKLKSVDGVVLHFISAKNIKPKNPFNLETILDIFKEYKVSAHYLIRRDGSQVELVPPDHKAFHAGKSRMNKRNGCNDFTIGIELEGGTDWPYEDAQILSLAELLAQIMTDHKFTLDWIKGHDEVRQEWNNTYPDMSATVKVDPGAHFPWEVLNDMLYSVSETNRK